MPRTRGEEPTQPVTVRMTDETVAQLRALRERLEQSQKFGRVSMGEALSFAVSSAGAALTADPHGGATR